MNKNWFKEKWKDILFIVISMMLVISGIALYKYLNERDIANISKDENNEILYKNELNNIFGDDWYESTFAIGKWTIGENIDDFTLTPLFYDDLSSNPTDIGEYYINLLNPVNSWNDNLYRFNVNEFPYFEIRFDGSREPIYQNLNLLVNNITFSGSNLWVDYSITNPNNNTSILITSQMLNKNYLIMNNESYYNYKVSFLRFRSGISISSDSTENGFSQRFGVSYTYSPFISITDGISPDTYQYLQTQFNDLQTQFNALNGAYNNLNNSYTTLEQNYSILLEQYNSLLNQSDYSFSELFWSISAVPFNVIKSGFNVNILGANIGSIITGLFTAAIVIWLFKKLFK